MDECERSWTVRKLLRHAEPAALARRAGDRLLHLVAGLEGGYAGLRLRSGSDGTVEIHFLSRGASEEDVTEWVWQDVAELVPGEVPQERSWGRFSEVLPAVRVASVNPWQELDPVPDAGTTPPQEVWPCAVLTDGLDVLLALRGRDAEVRLHLAPVNDMAAQMAAHELRHATFAADPQVFAAYQGQPVAARLLVGHDGALAPRLRAALLGRGSGLAVRPLVADARAWAGETETLQHGALPFGAAQCLTVVPAAGHAQEVCGVAVTYPSPRPVPVDDGDCREGLRLGRAVSNTGMCRDVRIGPDDLLLHTQLVGATGTGKSSLLAALVQEACRAGMGLTVLDPHGQLVDRILAETPEERGGRFLAVRSGDEERPVPLNPLAGPNPELMQDTMVQVFRELHDPGNHGFLGPVWERWLGVLLDAQRALIGRRANLALIPDMATDQRRLAELARKLDRADPKVSRELHSLHSRRPEEYGESVTWVVSKFQRLVGSSQMRGILASGRDAVDVVEVLDDRSRLLIDLASTTLGDLSAQLLGEMWLAKHWEALSKRRRRDQPHLLIVDEAHLFASGLLPRILTQARKYGVGVVVAHQNLQQLTGSLREAVLASTNNVVVFRTGIREADAALARLGRWPGTSLTRLERLTAAVSLNVGDGFTDPFTLVVDHNQRKVAGGVSRLRRSVEQLTRERFGLKDAGAEQLTYESLVRAADSLPGGPGRPREAATSDFLTRWLEERAERGPGNSGS